MYDYLQTIVEKIPDHLILYVGTNDTTDFFHQQIVNNLLALKHFKTKKNVKLKCNFVNMVIIRKHLLLQIWLTSIIIIRNEL